MEYTAIGSHRSEYPDPISFSKGALLVIGEKYEGPQAWDNWYFCTVRGQPGGWVPGQVIEWIDGCRGTAVEDYTAKELDVDEGDLLIGAKVLNGWVWCSRASDGQCGWVPQEVLQEETRTICAWLP